MKKGLLGRIIGIALVSFSAVSAAVATFAWFSKPGGQTSQHLDGEVSLRSYFYDGDGKSSTTAFEIVTPLHFYNLTRLQNLGLYSEDTWFQIGHNFGGDIGYACINKYKANGDPDPEYFLDMGKFSSETTILPIGGEGAPFYGHFDGKNLPVTNLTITGNPEDIGVFGYVAHGAEVKNLICKNLTIKSLGYSKTTTNPSNKLFSEDIDKLFDPNTNVAFARDTNLHFYTYNSAQSKYEELKENNQTVVLKTKSSTGATVRGINNPDNIQVLAATDTEPANNVFHGFFVPDYPAKNAYSPFTFSYSMRSSSPIIKEDTRLNVTNAQMPNGSGAPAIPVVIDLDQLAKSESFNSGKPMQVDVRLSLIASVTVDGFVFSRVIQSYTCEFYSNSSSFTGWVKRGSYTVGETSTPPVTEDDFYFFDSDVEGEDTLYQKESSTWNDGTTRVLTGEGAPTRATYTGQSQSNDPKYKYYLDTENLEVYEFNNNYYHMKIFCDYKQQNNDGTVEGNYHHGNNIGFLAGHVDGLMSKCYVYNGTLLFNGGGSAFVPIGTESETGLIGEIGTNVANSIEPSYGFLEDGDTGVLDISGIYDSIRSDASPDTIYGGARSGRSYYSYKQFTKTTTEAETEQFNKFKNYLTYYDGKQDQGHYISAVGMNLAGSNPAESDWHSNTITQANINSNAGFNAVDFLSNKIIEDDSVDRGLGAFKIITSYDASANTGTYGQHMMNNIGQSRIINGAPISKVYFSTAEYDYQKEETLGNNDFAAHRAITEPSYYDTKSFEYPFSRDYNYVYEMDLTKNTDAIMDDNYYMYNTTSGFLANYLYSKLIDDIGDPITPGDPHFGFMFNAFDFSKMTKMSSYMTVGNPSTEDKSDFGRNYYLNTSTANAPVLYVKADDTSSSGDKLKRIWKQQTLGTNYLLVSGTQATPDPGNSVSANQGIFLVDVRDNATNLFKSAKNVANNWEWQAISSADIITGQSAPAADLDVRCYPEKSIAFSITNSHGANVSVVGKGTGNITIYKNDTTSRKKVEPVFKMKSTKASSVDEHRFFDYDCSKNTNNTSSDVIDTSVYGSSHSHTGEMTDSGVLYGHIFKLDPGDYVVGSDSGTVDLYYLCVQGTDLGTIGTNTDMADVGNAITDVDFLTVDPINEATNTLTTLKYAGLTFETVLDSEYTNGEFYAGYKNNKFCLIFDDDGLVVSLRVYLRESDLSEYYILEDRFVTSKDYTEHLNGGGS